MNGKYNNIKEWIRAGLLTLTCLVMAVSSALFIVVNLSPLFINVGENILNLTNGQKLMDYWHLICYLQVPWVNELQLEYIPITATAVHHFHDVRILFILNEVLLVMTLFIAWHEFKREKRQAQLWRLNLPFEVIIVTVIFGGFMLITNFSNAFIGFHYLIFNNMDWIFSPHENPIILLMPESFFMTMFNLMIAISVGILVAMWGLVRLELYRFFRHFRL